MKGWQIAFEDRLGAPDAPPVLSRHLLARLARTSRAGDPIAASSLTHWLHLARARRKLVPVTRGLYLNAFRAPPGTPADAVPDLRLDAVVSLNTVLGDAGVLNNPSRIVTAVVPIDAGAPAPKLGRQRTHAGEFQFFGLPRRILDAGPVADRLEPPSRTGHVRATPEKALADWLYLGASPRSHRTPPPAGDIDLSRLDPARLRRIVDAMDLTAVFAAWRSGRGRPSGP